MTIIFLSTFNMLFYPMIVFTWFFCLNQSLAISRKVSGSISYSCIYINHRLDRKRQLNLLSLKLYNYTWGIFLKNIFTKLNDGCLWCVEFLRNQTKLETADLTQDLSLSGIHKTVFVNLPGFILWHFYIWITFQ